MKLPIELRVRGYFVILVAAVGIACGQAATPTAPSSLTSQSTGFFTSGSVQLSYRLDVPAHSAPVGAVVFGHGSGLQTKDSCRVFGLADGFLSRGYATLCFDKRGVGQSTGTQYIPVVPENSIAVFEDLASDMAAGVEFLRSRPEIDRNRIALAGVRQAESIVPIAAAKTQPAFMLLIVGPTVSIGVEHFYSSIVEVTNAPVEEGYKQLPSFNGVHGFDPKPVLESLNVPGLWLLGGEDRSIPTPATVAILDQLIASGKPYTHVVFPGIGHNLPPSWPEIEQWLAKIGR